MKNTLLIVNGVDTLTLYRKDCLFNKECSLAFVALKAANGHQHISSQCTKCGYQTGGPIPKKVLQPSDKVKAFNKRLYNAVYKKKLEEVYGMSGENEEMTKRLQQIKKALRSGKLLYPGKRTKCKPMIF